MITGENIAKRAFEKAIVNVRDNCIKLEEFIGQDIKIENKKDFLEFAEKVGDKNLARSFCIVKFGKSIIEMIK